ncbi:MAG: hypothetical protein L3K24_10200 [Gammaproteobacteria bacterium]|nr:hypothetical protein [Gammaproteobacteria bacterium]
MDKTTRRLIQGTAMAGVLLLTACEETPPEQLVEDFGIAYIKRPIVTEIDQDTNEVVLAETDISEVLGFTEGGDIWYRDRASPSANERNITFCLTQGLGDVRDLETSYDGSKIIFSLRLPDPDPDDDIEPTWDIYEYDTTTGACPQRIIRSNISADDGDDLAPHYLPDGRIVFTSTRQKGSGIVLSKEGKSRFRALDENLNEHAPQLHVISASGTDIQQISFNQSHDLDPTVLSTGEILFTRWDRMGNHDTMSLYSIRPDGTELKMVYGMHDDSADDVQFLSPRQLEDGRVLTMLKSAEGSAGRGSGAPAFIDIANYVDNTQPVWPQQGVLSGPAQTSVVDLDVRTDAGISANGRFRSIYPLWDGTNRALVSWSQCRRVVVEDNETRILPCLDDISADTIEAFPIYAIYIYDLDRQTQLPVVLPEEGWIIEEPVVTAPRRKPVILYDRVAGFELDQNLAEEDVGLLHIRSVYDFDGRFNRLGSGNATITSLGQLADPTRVTADERRARFLRIVKSVPIPDRDALNFDRSAFGAAGRQRMREIIGYAPIQPDGSVLVKVPANVPFAISVVDKDGRRIGGRHQNWLQLRAGETLTCNGCHSHNPSDGSAPLPHGAADAPDPVNRGAATEEPFPGTHANLIARMGETMAQARIRLLCGDFNTLTLCRQLSPSVNLQSVDEWWIDPTTIPAPAIDLRYDDPELVYFGTNAPAKSACQDNWDANCRTIINYETHIHPLWGQARPVVDANDVVIGDRTCTNCHNNVAIDSAFRVPASQLDLSDGPLDIDEDHFKSYRELLFPDDQQVLNSNGMLEDETQQVPRLDENGDQLFQDIIDADGVVTGRIPLFDLAPIPVESRAMRAFGSRGGTFMGKFLDPTDDHFGYLSATELRLIAEWLDIGAQYYNNPFDAPLN